MKFLIISDSPFNNYGHTQYAYNLTKYLINNNHEVVYIILNCVTTQEFPENVYYKNFSLNTIMNFYNTLRENISPEDKNILGKVKYIIRNNQKTNLDSNDFNKIIDSYNINICIASIIGRISGIKLDAKLSVPFIMNMRIEYEYPSNNYINYLQHADIYISNTDFATQKIKSIYPEKVILEIPNYIDIFNKLINGDIKIGDIQSTNNIKSMLNIPQNTKVFYIDLDIYDLSEQDRLLLDVHVRLLYKFINEHYQNSFLIINIKSDPANTNILKISNFDPNKCAVYNFYYDNNGYEYRNARYDLIRASDFIINLSGSEDLFIPGILGQFLGKPAFYNWTTGLKEQLFIGDFYEPHLDIYLCSDHAKTFIKYPVIKTCYPKLVNFFEKYKSHDWKKLYLNNVKNIKNSQYYKFTQEHFESQWNVLLSGLE